MPLYLTRHMEALSDVELGRNFYTKGQPFQATEMDAEYLKRAGKARDVSAPVAAAAPHAPAKPEPVAEKPASLQFDKAREDGAVTTATVTGSEPDAPVGSLRRTYTRRPVTTVQ